MKKLLVLLILLAGLLFPLACSDNNSNKGVGPTLPTGNAATATPTGSGSGLGTATATPVPPVLTLSPTPAFNSNYGTTTGPNGMYYDNIGDNLYVAQGGVSGVNHIAQFAWYQVSSGSLQLQDIGNLFITGYPTPQPNPPTPGVTPAWSGVTLQANFAQGYAYTVGFFAMLDSSTSGSATLWMGCTAFDFGQIPVGSSQYPGYTSGYGAPAGYAFASPRAVAGDSMGNFYVADSGNGYIDQFTVACPSGPPPGPASLHRWNGYSSSAILKKPVALACDSFNNVWVGDAGYTPGLVQEYSSGGTTVIGSWTLQAGCVINGLAVDSLGDFYVSDLSFNGQVEEYKVVNSTAVTLVREWGDPHGPHEFLPYAPSCIALITSSGPPSPPQYFVVGDTNNNLLDVFGP